METDMAITFRKGRSLRSKRVKGNADTGKTLVTTVDEPLTVNVLQVEDPASLKEQMLGNQLVDKAADPTDVKRLCETYGLRREDLGRMTGFSLRALAEWSAGKLPSEPARRRLHEIRRLLDALAEVVKIDAIPTWLKTRNPAFDNLTPIQAIEVGEIDRLWQMVHQLGSESVS